MCTVVTTQATLIKLHQISVFQFVNSSEFLHFVLDSPFCELILLSPGLVLWVSQLACGDLGWIWVTVGELLTDVFFLALKKHIPLNILNIPLENTWEHDEHGSFPKGSETSERPTDKPPVSIFKALMKLLSYLKTSSHERFLSCRRWPLPRYAGNIFPKASEAVTLRVETLKICRRLEPSDTEVETNFTLQLRDAFQNPVPHIDGIEAHWRDDLFYRKIM